MVHAWLDKLARSRTVFTRADSYHAGVDILLSVPALIVVPHKVLATLHLPQQIKTLKPAAGFPTFTLDMIGCKDITIHSDFHQREALIETVSI